MFAVPARRPVLGSLASVTVGQVALIVTGVIAARTLGPEDRGYLALVVLVPTVLHIVGTLGLPRAATYFIASEPAQEQAVVRAIRGPALLQAATLTVLEVAVFAVLLSDDPSEVKWAGVAAIPLLAANVADLYGKAILQGQRRYTAFNVLRNAAMTFYLAGVVAIAAAGKTSLLWFTFVFVVANVLSAIVTLTTALRGGDERTVAGISRRELFRFGLRGYLVSLSPTAAFRLDQAVIGVLLSPKALGLYVVGLAFTNLPSFISRSVGLIAYPQVASAGSARARQSHGFLWFTLALSGGAVAVLELSAGWLVPLFFGSEFVEAVPLARVLLLAAFFEGVRILLTETSSGSGRPGLGSIAEVTSWVVLAVSLAILMPIWQELGVAWATTIAALTSLVVLVLLIRSDATGGRQPGAAVLPATDSQIR